MKHLLVTAMVLVILLPMSGVAQDFAPVTKDQNWKKLQVIERLKPGSLVRIQAKDIGRIKGVYHDNNSDSIFVSENSTKSSVAIESIDALWVRGRATGTGALIGAASLGAAGLCLGLVVGTGSSSGEGSFLSGEGGSAGDGAMAGLVGGFVGGAIGAVLGSVIPKWHRRYRSPDYDINSKELRSKGHRLSILPTIHKGGTYVSASLSF